MADNQGAATTSLMRDYRKGNWTVSETMILIEAKKMDDERRMKRSTGNDSEGGSIRINKPAELRWKWVEDYCWRKGCMRSQNQCNDKWDNLMRDYKKVRDYERKVMADHQGISTSSATDQSYWKLEKNERKDKNLPTNMLPQIYEALVEVVEKKPPRALAALVPITSTPPATVVGYNVVERIIGGGGGSGRGSGTSIIHHHQQQTPLVASAQALLQHHISPSPITALPLPPAVPAAPSPMQAQPLPYPQPILPTVDSDTSENPSPHSPAKRRRKTDQQQQQQQQQEQGTTSASARISTGTSSSNHEVAFAISKSASIIAEALQACEEREERRHRDLLSLHERRLKIEESKTEVNRQGINGLVDAINNLANSIQALASDKHQSTSKPS
ncbi:hypothetical protein L484_025906 [Morus notabilis]|uniref:Myb-like domain-containing protein n=1 Tax=Morus notabilis TaxID=981085 RepID=W9R7D1_9ROSA|nr:hypothetical protein L484_025906 [Morus notabilis]